MFYVLRKAGCVKLKKISKRKKIIVAVSLIVILAVVGGVLYYVLRPDEGSKVTLTSVSRGNITQKLETSGTVESANQSAFTVLQGTQVEEVFVRVGDKVEKGQLLAAFDTSSLSDVLSEKKKAFESAKTAYNNFVATASDSTGDLAEISKQIKTLEAEMKELQAVVDEQQGTASDSSTENETGSKLRKFLGLDNSNSLLGRISNLLGGNSASSSMVSSILSGGSMSSFDISSLGEALGKTEEEQKLISDTLELAQLKAKQLVLQTQTNASLESVYKLVYENAEKAYVEAEKSIDKLKNGWYAENDGIIREVNITAGTVYAGNDSGSDGKSPIDVSSLLGMISSGSTSDISSLISGLFSDSTGGMVVEYYPFEVSFVIGKYDVSKVHMDQPVKITSVSGKEFDGQIVYISPVATAESSINISSLLGSSGSSSGIEVRVSVPDPDESVIIGFDVDVSIDVETSENALLVPMSALQYSSDGKVHVFVYDESSKTISQKEITTGLFDGDSYEVIKGIKESDIIVKSPMTTMKDGDRISIRTIETGTTKNVK